MKHTTLCFKFLHNFNSFCPFISETYQFRELPRPHYTPHCSSELHYLILMNLSILIIGARNGNSSRSSLNAMVIFLSHHQYTKYFPSFFKLSPELWVYLPCSSVNKYNYLSAYFSCKLFILMVISTCENFSPIKNKIVKK